MPDQPITKAFGGEEPTTRDVIDALDRAAKDDRVSGLVARVGAAPMGLAQIQEIRDALRRFRASGKPAIAWAETFGEFGAGNGSYYLATAFDEIYLQPSGDIGLTGLMYESPFIKNLFAKLDVVPRMDHRYEYKNAMNFYTETNFTDPHREAMKKLMDSQFGQMVAGIAKGRGLSGSQVARRRSTTVPTSGSRRSTRSWSTGCSTATRSTPRRARRPARTPSSSTSRSTSSARAVRTRRARRSR